MKRFWGSIGLRSIVIVSISKVFGIRFGKVSALIFPNTAPLKEIMYRDGVNFLHNDDLYEEMLSFPFDEITMTQVLHLSPYVFHFKKRRQIQMSDSEVYPISLRVACRDVSSWKHCRIVNTLYSTALRKASVN